MFGTTLALGLGSNLGHSIEFLRAALAAIRNLKDFRVLQVSSIYESDALMPENAPSDWNKKYLNAVVLVKVDGAESPADWLRRLKQIEAEIGRKKSEVWAPREIDIDILYWDKEPLLSVDLNIPHKRLFERPFALLPLLEVWPELRIKIGEQLPDWASPCKEQRPFNTKVSGYVWPRLVGILNVTPDSFSDGGLLQNEDALRLQLKKFSENQVDIIDVGAESTRPNSAAVTPQEELSRLEKAFSVISSYSSFKISLDCRRGEVVEKILSRYHVDYLNDVSGFETSAMQKVLKDSGKKSFVMHSLGVPPSKNAVLPEGKDPFQELKTWWAQKCEQLAFKGIPIDRLVFDPGIGFGKTSAQSFYLLKHLEKFNGIKNEIMIGHSRKSFLTLLTDKPAADRDAETALVTQNLNQAHVQYLRIHEPKSQLAALKLRGLSC